MENRKMKQIKNQKNKRIPRINRILPAKCRNRIKVSQPFVLSSLRPTKGNGNEKPGKHSSPSCLLVVCHCVFFHHMARWKHDEEWKKGVDWLASEWTTTVPAYPVLRNYYIYYFMASNEKLIKIYFFVYYVWYLSTNIYCIMPVGL